MWARSKATSSNTVERLLNQHQRSILWSYLQVVVARVSTVQSFRWWAEGRFWGCRRSSFGVSLQKVLALWSRCWTRSLRWRLDEESFRKNTFTLCEFHLLRRVSSLEAGPWIWMEHSGIWKRSKDLWQEVAGNVLSPLLALCNVSGSPWAAVRFVFQNHEPVALKGSRRGTTCLRET